MKNINILVLAVLMLSAAACEWTEPQSLDYTRETFEERDPSGYAAYLQNLREYKKSDHKVMILTMKGTSGYPVLRSQHLTAMPDSADYICVTVPGELHYSIAEEISSVKEKKGTRALASVDFSVTDAEWLEYKNAKMDAGEPEPTAEECMAFFRNGAEAQLAYCDRYDFEGIIVSFEDVVTLEEERNSQIGFMEAVSAWKKSHAAHLMMMRGNVNLITDKELVSQSDGYILVLGGSSGEANYKSKLRNVFRTIDKKDRCIFEVMVPTAEEPKQFGDSPLDAAEIIMSKSIEDYAPYKVLGLAVSNAHDDYFNQNFFLKSDVDQKDPIFFGNFVNIRRALKYFAESSQH